MDEIPGVKREFSGVFFFPPVFKSPAMLKAGSLLLEMWRCSNAHLCFAVLCVQQGSQQLKDIAPLCMQLGVQ